MSISKPNLFDTYQYILHQQFQSVLNLPSFTSFCPLSPDELISIGQCIIECFTKLGDLSEFYIKKINDINTAVNVSERLQKMLSIHNELLEWIRKFSCISSDVALNMKEIATKNLSAEISNYIHFDTINKYRTIILQIADCIRRINVYGIILKDKLSF
jgi:hypothetical protein